MSDKLNEYVDGVFAPYEGTKSVSELKADLLADLQERFRELRAEGKDEATAFELTIDSIGDIERDGAGGVQPLPGSRAAGGDEVRRERPAGKRLRGRHGADGKFGASALRGSNFSDADLTGSKFKSSDVAEANFDGANLTDAILTTADLARAELPQGPSGPHRLQHVRARPSPVRRRRAHRRQVPQDRPDGAPSSSAAPSPEWTSPYSDLRGLNFDGATFTSVKFDRAALEGVTFRGATLRDCSFRGLEQEVLQGPPHRELRRGAHGQADLRRAQGLRRRTVQRDRRIRREPSMQTPDLAIQVKGLQKSYGELQVLKGVDFAVARGSIFALLGSNGAGKTTVVRILTTLLKPDGGTASVNGFDVAVAAGAGAGVDQPDRAVRRGRRDPHRPGKPDHDRQTAAGEEPAPGRGRPARNASASPRRPAAGWRPTRAACAAASTSP